jgi:predicted metalloprotease with PDZ domain
MDWPESFGFSIAGDGPCYVIAVEKGSVAQSAGVCIGDQLIELDGHNVREMSSESVATIAQHSRTNPPTLGVVARLQQVELTASRRWGFGLSLRGARPPQVDSVDPPGPAYQAGIRPGTSLHQRRLLSVYAYVLCR